jgi:branched-chain amino acid transport system substrate-binding protein
MVTEKRLTRRDFIKVAALSGAGLVAAACAPQAATVPAKEKIVVGLARPLSGPLAIIGDSAFRPVYETWVAEVNAAGGIEVAEYGKKLPVELLVYDDKSDLGTMTRLTEKLIVEDKVDFLWPACSTAFFFAQAPIANKYGYILMSAEAGASSLKDMLPSMPYVFASLSFSDWNQIPVLAELLAEQGAKTAYIIYIADLFGIEYSGVAGIEFPKQGIEIVGVKSVPPDIKDLSPIIADAKASEADVFCCLAYPDQVLPATGTSMALGYNPKAWIGGPGVNFGFYQAAFGPAAEGVSGFAGWSPKQSEATKQLADTLYAGKPQELNDWWGHPFYWANLEMWKQAIEKAGTLDQDKIREIIATEKFDTVMGPTWFENNILAKEAHLAEIGQWQNGEYEVIGPKDKATAEMVYPKPEWPAT